MTLADAMDPQILLSVLARVKDGDFTVRMPSEWTGVAGEVATSINDVIISNQLFEIESARVSRAVGVRGELSERASITDLGIFQTDAANRYVYTNPRWSQIMGVPAEDAAGQYWEPFVGLGEGPQGGGSERSSSSEQQSELSRRFVVSCPGSTPRTIFVTARTIPDALGGRAGWVGTVADVTAEAAAEIAASHFRAVVESSRDAIISKDLDNVITSWNAGAQRLFGYSTSEAIGKSISMLVPRGQDNEMPDLLRRARSGELVDSYETIRRRKNDTTVDVSLTTSPILGPGGIVVGASIIARDISDRRKAEHLKDEFLALVSHELRTPLSSIVAHIELLLDDELADANIRRHFLQVIDRNSKRLERLVGDLLFVAQLESANLSLSMTDVDIVAVVADAIEVAEPQAQQSNVEVMLVAPEGAIMLTGDPGRLGQAIDNLISNAVKYSPEGGGVTIRITANDVECIIEIEDNGIGIAVEEQDKLFDRFFRASVAVSLHIQGVGLGLSIVKRIIDGHGGQVGVSSRPGSGTTFRIALPLSQSRIRLGSLVRTLPTEPRVL